MKFVSQLLFIQFENKIFNFLKKLAKSKEPGREEDKMKVCDYNGPFNSIAGRMLPGPKMIDGNEYQL